MGVGQTVGIDPLTIASGQTLSGNVGRSLLRWVKSVTFFAPGTLPETVTVQVSRDPDATSPVWQNYQEGGADITLSAGDSTTIYPTNVGGLRLQSGVGVAADRVIAVMLGEN